MSSVADTLYYRLVCTMAVWVVLLWALARVKRPPTNWRAKVATGAAAALLAVVPAAGLPVWKWAFSFCPNPSLALLAIMVASVVRRLDLGVQLFTASDRKAAWFFGAAVGTVLYLQPFCLPAFDLYYWGSHPQLVAWSLAGAAIFFLGWGSRFGAVFLFALAAYDVRLLESHNGWEYAMDPFYWLISIGVVVTALIRRLARSRARPVASPSVVPDKVRVSP